MILLILVLQLFSTKSYTIFDISSIAEHKIDSTYYVEAIVFHGNVKTRESVLSRSLTLTPQTNYVASEIRRRVVELRNISGIYDTEFSCDIGTTGYVLNIYIEEQKTLLPLLDFGLQATNKWLQIGLVDINFLGLGDELLTYYQNNQGRHSGQVYYRKNNAFHTKYGAHLNVLRWQSVEPLNFSVGKRFNYIYTLNLFGAGFHWNNNQGLEWELSSSYFAEEYQRVLSDRDSPKPEFLELRKVLGKIQGKYSTIRYDGIYKDNFEIVGNYQNVYTVEYKDFFNILQFEFSHFKRIRKKEQLAFRTSLGIADNTVSPFAPFVIDAYHNVRGAGDRPLRGSGLVTYNIELRKEIGATRDFTLQALLFNDAAVIRQSGTEIDQAFALESTRISIGGGLRLSYSKIVNAVLRVDYAHELIYKNSQLVMGLGQYF